GPAGGPRTPRPDALAPGEHGSRGSRGVRAKAGNRRDRVPSPAPGQKSPARARVFSSRGVSASRRRTGRGGEAGVHHPQGCGQGAFGAARRRVAHAAQAGPLPGEGHQGRRGTDPAQGGQEGGSAGRVTSRKVEGRAIRHVRVRRLVRGTADRPRLAVFRSLNHIYAQLIDDTAGRTLAEVDSRSPAFRERLGTGGNVAAAKIVGELIGQKAKERGISRAVFDRGGYQYHGRVKALAEAARGAGLQV